MIIQSIFTYGVIILISVFWAEIANQHGLFKIKINKYKTININFFNILAVLTPSFFSGIRVGIGTDYKNYLQYFEEYSSGNLVYAKDTEIGYKLINILCIKAGMGFQFVLFIMSLITMIFVFKTIQKYKKDYSVGLAYFVFLLCYYQYSFNAVRQVAAMAICFYSVSFLKTKEFSKSLFWNICAMTIHNSAIINMAILLIYWIYQGDLNKYIKKTLIFIIAFSFLFYDYTFGFILSILPGLSRYGAYLERTNHGNVGISIFVRYGIILIPFILNNKRMIKENIPISPYILYFIGFIFKMATYSAVLDYSSRMIQYFQMYEILCIPLMIRFYKLKGKQVYSFFIIAAICVFWIYDYFILKTSGTIPYVTIFSKGVN